MNIYSSTESSETEYGFHRESDNERIHRYGEQTIGSQLYCYAHRAISVVFTVSFLSSLLTASIATDVAGRIRDMILTAIGKPPSERRPFRSIEKERMKYRNSKDKIIVTDINYYAQLVGLQAKQFMVITEDRFVLQLFRIMDPNETEEERSKRYPVLLIHGLLQSAGAFCVNEESSLAFYLCKSGYDVWLGNNRCGFSYDHLDYKYNDPRMWEWDVRDMGSKDLPGFVDYVLRHTKTEKIGLVCHSQGTAQTLLALSRYYIPELGEKISGFCGLAPAVYAGPLVDRKFFKFIRYLPPRLYRLAFGIHAFIPSMLILRRYIPHRLLSYLSYSMFHFMFRWTDFRWDRFLEGRMFQFSPVYISAESMRWWLGQDGFATRRCIFEEETEDSWYDDRCPPMALWIAENDSIVDGRRFVRRLQNHEPHVNVVRTKVIPMYEHLDVLWAIDAPDQVGVEVKEALWMTAHDRSRFRCPTECEEL
ncbi:Alpha/Beta hydrolase protein [Dipodascopsis uninucleata]